MRESSTVTLTRLLIARYKRERVDSFIHEGHRTLEAPRANGGSRGENAQHDRNPGAPGPRGRGPRRPPDALRALERALTLAEPGGVISGRG